MNPLPAAWNCTPRFTALASVESTAPEGAAFCQMLPGHWGPAVVKLQENGLLIGVPELFCAPDTVAGQVGLDASPLLGVNVATGLPLLKPPVPAAGRPREAA